MGNIFNSIFTYPHTDQPDNQGQPPPADNPEPNQNLQGEVPPAAQPDAQAEDQWEDASDNHSDDADDDDDSDSQHQDVIMSEEEGSTQQQEQEHEQEESKVMKEGCQHYRRGCMKKCEECKEFFNCRFCHDEVKYLNEKDIKKAHQFDRFKTKEVKCLKCEHIQPISPKCEQCEFVFACYYCDICKFHDDDYVKKQIYHCDKCGICRVGKGSAYHCDACGCCMANHLKDNHECKNDRMQDDCAVCMEKLFTSRDAPNILRCGHSMHGKCFRQYSRTNLGCPWCRKSIIDPKLIEAEMDNQVTRQPMPHEYKDMKAHILCNDCMSKNIVAFHFIAMKCPDCKSYNTSQITGK